MSCPPIVFFLQPQKHSKVDFVAVLKNKPVQRLQNKKRSLFWKKSKQRQKIKITEKCLYKTFNFFKFPTTSMKNNGDRKKPHKSAKKSNYNIAFWFLSFFDQIFTWNWLIWLTLFLVHIFVTVFVARDKKSREVRITVDIFFRFKTGCTSANKVIIHTCHVSCELPEVDNRLENNIL